MVFNRLKNVFMKYFHLMLLMTFSLSYLPVAYSDNPLKNKTWYPVLGFGGGIAQTLHYGSRKIFPIIDPDTDQEFRYSPNQNTPIVGFFNVFIGLEVPFNTSWFVQTNLEFTHISPVQIDGNLIQATDIESFDEYTYQYHIISNMTLINAKLLYTIQNIVHPYLSAGVGMGANKSSQYLTNAPPTLTFTRFYEPNTQYSFAYAVGLGADVDVTDNLRIGFGYRFNDAGKSSFGKANIDGELVSGSLKERHSYNNQLYAQLTWKL